MWLWATATIAHNPVFDWGVSLDAFMRKWLREPSVVYFHNLKFDGSFLLNWLLINGWNCVEDGSGLGVGEFTTLISGMGQFYTITIRSEFGETEFRDSLKVIPLPVAKIPRAFGLANDSKGSIDYELPRPVGYCPTHDEVDYVRSDVVIVAKALAQQEDEGFTKLTAGANALANYRTTHSARWWEAHFPILDVSMDAAIRKAYRGGFTYTNPKFSKRIVGPVKVFDVNSLYPSVMYYEELPYGMPVWVNGCPPEGMRPLFIAHIEFTARLKSDHIPCIQIKGSNFFGGTEYLSAIDEPVDMWVSSVDLELWREQYDVEITAWYGAFMFHAKAGMFNQFIDFWMDIKVHSKGGRKQLAKLQLNSLYGKFATNPDVTGKFPHLKDGHLAFHMGEPAQRDPVYTAMGVFITAYARAKTIRAAQAHHEDFAYADTDSLHLVTDSMPKDLDVDPNRLGWWKHEGDFDNAYYARAKCYTEHKVVPGMHRMNPKRHVWDTHIAGLPRSVAADVRFTTYGEAPVRLGGKLVPRQVPGGVVLSDVGFLLEV